MADVIAFVTAATIEKDQPVDRSGKLCLSMLRLAHSLWLDSSLVELPIKRRSGVKKVSASALGTELPEGSKVFYADEAEDYEQVLRYLSSHRSSMEKPSALPDGTKARVCT